MHHLKCLIVLYMQLQKVIEIKKFLSAYVYKNNSHQMRHLQKRHKRKRKRNEILSRRKREANVCFATPILLKNDRGRPVICKGRSAKVFHLGVLTQYIHSTKTRTVRRSVIFATIHRQKQRDFNIEVSTLDTSSGRSLFSHFQILRFSLLLALVCDESTGRIMCAIPYSNSLTRDLDEPMCGRAAAHR